MSPMKTARSLAAAVACAVLVAAGCNSPTEPQGTAFPRFTLVDVNPYTPTSGQNVTENSLVGPAAIVYFGWAT